MLAHKVKEKYFLFYTFILLYSISFLLGKKGKEEERGAKKAEKKKTKKRKEKEDKERRRRSFIWCRIPGKKIVVYKVAGLTA